MKPHDDFEPVWGVLIGVFIAPLACALNAALIEAYLRGFSGRISSDWLPIWVVMTFITAPQGLFTMRILETWQRDSHAARRASLVLGLPAMLFWFWCWHGLEMSAQWGRRDAMPLFAAFLLPFIWSLLFLVFALFARPPKKS
jgi:hypothetical protein